MRVLVVFAHPVKESFSGHLVEIVRNSLSAAGHDVDFIDLYAEAFSPALTEEERSSYYVADKPREPTIERYIHQLQAAESVVLVFPVWNYGFPAMLKGYFDRVYVTGVAFNVEGSSFIPTLRHIRKVAVVTTYGGDRLRTALMGDPPRLLCRRMLWSMFGTKRPPAYLALYGMDGATFEKRKYFSQRVAKYFSSF